MVGSLLRLETSAAMLYIAIRNELDKKKTNVAREFICKRSVLIFSICCSCVLVHYVKAYS